MNRKGQMQNVGIFLGLFVGIVVVLSLLSGSIYQNIGTLTNTVTQVNQTITFPTSTGSVVLNGQAVSNVRVINASTGGLIAAGNYTITNYDVSTGSLRATINGVPGQAGTFNGSSANITYTYEPLGYIADSGSRSFTAVLPVFLVLALVAFVVGKMLSQKGIEVFD